MIQLSKTLYSKKPNNGKYYVIAIDGRGGSGKTTLTDLLRKSLNGFTFITGDDYFEPTPNAVSWGGFNEDRFKEEVLEPIKHGYQTILYRPYDWHKEPHISEIGLILNKGVVIERVLSFDFNLDYDLKIWVDTPEDVALARGLERDSMFEERAKKVWTEIWKPKEDKYIDQRNPIQSADIILEGTKPFENQIV